MIDEFLSVTLLCFCGIEVYEASGDTTPSTSTKATTMIKKDITSIHYK